MWFEYSDDCFNWREQVFTHGGAGGVVKRPRPSPQAAQTHLITAQWKLRAHQHYGGKTLAAFNAPRLPLCSHHPARTHTHTRTAQEKKRRKRGVVNEVNDSIIWCNKYAHTKDLNNASETCKHKYAECVEATRRVISLLFTGVHKHE